MQDPEVEPTPENAGITVVRDFELAWAAVTDSEIAGHTIPFVGSARLQGHSNRLLGSSPRSPSVEADV